MYQLLFPAADTTGRQGRGHGVIDRLLDREKRDIRLIRTTEHIHQIMIQRVMYDKRLFNFRLSNSLFSDFSMLIFFRRVIRISISFLLT